MTNPLEDIIWAEITQNGPMDVGRFMGMALGHPQYGYYNTRDPFGRAGDFTTAPEISQMFGEMIGAWAADIWAQMGRPDPFILLECGPGRGSLMADALRVTKRVDGFHAAAKIVLMEMSPVLRARQREALDGYAVKWVDGLDDPLLRMTDYPVICIANEFLDALPVRQFVRQGDLWHERVVGVYDGELAFGLSPPVAPPCDADSDGIYEIAPARNDFMRTLARCLRGGAGLFIDYGYTRSQAGDSLQAVMKHEFVPVLAAAGMADITSHVDFDAAAQAAQQAGLQIHGPVTQGAYLEALGITMRAEMLKRGGADAAMIDAALARLTSEREMGALFKVLCVTDNAALRPAGIA